MAQVHLWGDLRRASGGVKSVEIEAGNISELIAALEDQFPELRDKGLADMTVAIDGELMSNADFEPVRAETEVHFLPPISGG